MWTKRTIAAVTVGGLAVAGATGVAVASGDGEQFRERAQEQIQTWVEDGSLTEEDAEAFARVQEQFQAERAERRAERQAEREAHQQELADAAGVSVDDLKERLRDGETLADIAGDNAAAVEAVLTTRAQERIAEGRERLDEAESSIDERVDDLMNGEGGPFGEGFSPGGHRGGPGNGPGEGPGGPGGLGGSA
jgi:hypothetical protein